MVRNWRNHPDVQKFMHYKEYITPEMQQSWFERISERGDLYFIINYESKDIGLANVKNIDEGKREGEGGIFIAESGFLNSHVPFRASLCLNDFVFGPLNFRRSYAHILDDNKRAIRYNKAIGYKPTDEIGDESNRLYILEKEDHITCSNRLKMVLQLN